MADRKRQLRCAIYTRKSSEEGLEQDFNSLHAQREACEAYIASQKSEGWTRLSTHYDDGGFSGGTLQRPALQRLLADIEESSVDVIVVYKIDRLSRSLMDFAKLVEVFDRKNVTFVSVTQSFNTTTSMGRLTLNILLSFAQFEREVTGERIRDKIAASKKKGLWMGGFVPLGYRPNDRTLAINETEAEQVRAIFRLYLDRGTVPALEAELTRLGIKSPPRVTASGSTRGDRSYSRGHLYQLLSNPLYIGEIDHKGQRYPGKHARIIDKATWDAVQIRLQANTQGGGRRRRDAKEPSLLAGLLFDEAGRRLVATHAVKRGRRYRYYITAPQEAEPGKREAVTRIPAPEIEPVVLRQVTCILGQTARLIDELNLHQHDPDALNRVVEAAKHLISELENTRGEDRRHILVDLIGRVTIGIDSLLIEMRRSQLADRLLDDDRQPYDGADHPIAIQVPLRISRRGVETRLIIEGESAARTDRPADPALVRSIARGYAWFEDLISGRATSIKAIAQREGLSDRYITRLLDLAFLTPALVEDILEGRQSADMTVDRLCCFAQGERPGSALVGASIAHGLANSAELLGPAQPPSDQS